MVMHITVYTRLAEEAEQKDMKLRSYSLQLYVSAVTLYLILDLAIPLNRATREAYNFTMSQAHIIAFITAMPLFGVWFVAFFCYGRLQKYAAAIRGSKEGVAFGLIADGVMVLSWGLVVQAFASLILGGISDHVTGFSLPALALLAYIKIGFALTAFTLIGSGARRLLSGKQYANLANSRLLLLLFAIIATVYSYLSLHLRLNHPGTVPRLPIAWLIATVTIPYIYGWFLGLMAVFDINTHARTTKGRLYRNSLNLLAMGLICLLIASIVMQYLNSLFISNLGYFSIDAVLLIDYFLLAGMTLGYVLMINGVRGLQRIEDI